MLFAQGGVNSAPNRYKFDKQFVHFGFTIGFNTADFSIRNSGSFLDTATHIYSIENKQMPGFQIGPISNFRIADHWDLRFLVNLTFSQRNLTYYHLDRINQDGEKEYDFHVMKLPSTFIEFPVLVKFKGDRINNYRFYVIGGANAKLDLASKKKIPEVEKPRIRLAQPDYYGEIGVGVDFYLPYFKFSPEIKYSTGFTNVAVPDGSDYTNSMLYLKSNMIYLSFHFE